MWKGVLVRDVLLKCGVKSPAEGARHPNPVSNPNPSWLARVNPSPSPSPNPNPDSGANHVCFLGTEVMPKGRYA